MEIIFLEYSDDSNPRINFVRNLKRLECHYLEGHLEIYHIGIIEKHNCCGKIVFFFLKLIIWRLLDTAFEMSSRSPMDSWGSFFFPTDSCKLYDL